MKLMPRKGISSKALVLLMAMLVSVGSAVGGTVAWLADDSAPNVTVFADSNILISLDDMTEASEFVRGSLNEELSDEDLLSRIVDTHKALADNGGTEYDASDNIVQMIPGTTVGREPVITVQADSEKCYVFIKVEKSLEEITVDGVTYGFNDYLSFAVDTDAGWIPFEPALDITDIADIDAINAAIAAAEGVYYRVVDKSEADQYFSIVKDGCVLVNPDVTVEMMEAVTEYPALSFTAYAIQYYVTNDTPFDVTEAWGQVSATSVTE